MTKEVCKFRYFFAWQQDEHEDWLREQARRGLHLSNVIAGVLHWFKPGVPADVAYSWDRVPGQDRDGYDQLFIDAGWERAAETQGWCCWRKVVIEGQVMEIFTDRASRQRNSRLWAQFYGAVVATSIPLIWFNHGFWLALMGYDDQVGHAVRFMLGVSVIACVLCAISLIRVLLRLARV